MMCISYTCVGGDIGINFRRLFKICTLETIHGIRIVSDCRFQCKPHRCEPCVRTQQLNAGGAIIEPYPQVYHFVGKHRSVQGIHTAGRAQNYMIQTTSHIN